ncbi:MAG: TolC family protein [Pyrinomonadaceae bacterium]|jgi:outer membrane protein
MKWQAFLVINLFAATASIAAFAQVPTPTPAQQPAPTVAPEKLQGVPSIAPDYKSDNRNLPDLGRVGVNMLDQRTLTLEEAISMALENNNDIEVTRKNVKIAEFDLRAARGVFQPRLTGQTSFERSTTPNISIFSTNSETTQTTLVGNLGVTGFIPSFGTVLRADVTNQRLTTTNPISILSPQNNASLGFTITQPLFRGRAFDQNRRTIEIAKRNLALTDAQFRQKTIDTIVNVQRAYWDLVFALKNLQVQRDSVRDAKEQYEHNKRLVDEGQLAPIDIVAAETQVANFEQAVYDALNIVNQAENILKSLIAANKNDGIWNQALTPVDTVDLRPPDTTLAEAVNSAMANRPELELNQVQKDINDIDRRYFSEQKKPQIDLVLGYNSAGVGGTQNPNFRSPFPLPCQQDPNSPACRQQLENLALLTGNAYSGVFDNRYPTYRAGLQINLPLFGDKTAGAQYGRTLVEGERLELQRAQIEQLIQVDVRNALQAVRTAEARLRAAAIARENSAKQYESERRKLDVGQSDIYKVLDRQTAYAAARSAELRAQTELNKAIADLQRATGNSLKANNIEARLRR